VYGVFVVPYLNEQTADHALVMSRLDGLLKFQLKVMLSVWLDPADIEPIERVKTLFTFVIKTSFSASFTTFICPKGISEVSATLTKVNLSSSIS